MFSFLKKKLWGSDATPAPPGPEAKPQDFVAPAPVPEAAAQAAQPLAPAMVLPPVHATARPGPESVPDLAGLPAPTPGFGALESAAPESAAPLSAAAAPAPAAVPAPARGSWLARLSQGLRKTGASIAQVFTGTRIDDDLYEQLESALLLADTGVSATEFLLSELKRRVKETKATDPAAVKLLLVDALTELLLPLQQPLQIGATSPTVIMVTGVNGAGKTTSIGKLTRHLAQAQCKVLLAAADTFRAAAREQLAVWADRNQVEIVSQAGGDPAAVTFDAVSAGRARQCDVVIADTAGRLPTQTHLMDELKKIKRVIGKAQEGAPHEVLLVVDGNTGQNALAQVKAFDAALGLSGLVVTKLDGTAKGGVLAAIARWGQTQQRVVPVYFIGIGEKLEDLQTFEAREFAQALLA
jgi:fused signal recognition particle receptor